MVRCSRYTFAATEQSSSTGTGARPSTPNPRAATVRSTPAASSHTMIEARLAPTTVLTSRTIVWVASSSRTVVPRISLMA